MKQKELRTKTYDGYIGLYLGDEFVASNVSGHIARRLVECWNEHDGYVDREAGHAKTEIELIAKLASFKAKADCHDDLLALLRDILKWDGILPHSQTRIKQAIARAEAG